MLETLASELEVEIGRMLSTQSDLLRVHASHGFAIEKDFALPNAEPDWLSTNCPV